MVTVESRVEAPPCPGCGERAWVKDRPVVDLVDLTCFGRPVTFRWRKHRWHCLPDQVAIPGPGNHILIRAYALAECGRLPEASRLATAAYEATPASAPPSALMWLAHQIGRCALLAGQLATTTVTVLPALLDVGLSVTPSRKGQPQRARPAARGSAAVTPPRNTASTTRCFYSRVFVDDLAIVAPGPEQLPMTRHSS